MRGDTLGLFVIKGEVVSLSPFDTMFAVDFSEMPFIRQKDVKNCEGCELLQYFQANKLTCYSFMHAGRKHETLGSETKKFITHSTASNMRFTVTLGLSFPMGLCRAAQVDAA